MPFSAGRLGGSPPSLSHRAYRYERMCWTYPYARDNDGHMSQTQELLKLHNGRVTPELLTRTVQDYLNEASGAVVLENGSVAFDLGRAKYSISGEHNKCLLHLWSVERNTVRRVLDAEV